ncbi:hypothetical protein NHX12_014547 [Muraenolepis orangiensis]|uniref:Uncharacterized protein n=1 Tax=Muraenolepis orangiensis TaxID=630683 RepID=A0A9Q0I577_9TELE|nr:hypothetical protein NHX12_014547 [Muraenolepis orangiensis]
MYQISTSTLSHPSSHTPSSPAVRRRINPNTLPASPSFSSSRSLVPVASCFVRVPVLGRLSHVALLPLSAHRLSLFPLPPPPTLLTPPRSPYASSLSRCLSPTRTRPISSSLLFSYELGERCLSCPPAVSSISALLVIPTLPLLPHPPRTRPISPFKTAFLHPLVSDFSSCTSPISHLSPNMLTPPHSSSAFASTLPFPDGSTFFSAPVHAQPQHFALLVPTTHHALPLTSTSH